MRKKYNNEAYEDTKQQVENREARNRARAQAVKKFGAAALKGNDVGHLGALDNSKSRAAQRNQLGNVKLQDVTSNRGWRRGRKGYSVPDL